MGPTVPFVLGALARPIGEAPANAQAGRDKLTRLLTTLRDAPRRRGVSIHWCANIRAYVATSMPFVEGLAWDVQDSDPQDFETLVDALWRQYGSFILAGEYSIDDGVWHRFTEDEIGAIEQLLGPNDTEGEQPA